MVLEVHKTDSLQAGWGSPDESSQYLDSDRLRWRYTNRPYVWRPPTDVFETDSAIVVRVEIGGMRDADFSITLEDRRLSIGGVRSDIPERRAYHQMEIPFGEFNSTVELPSPVVLEEIDAVYRDGFLRITLAKARPRQIHIVDQ